MDQIKFAFLEPAENPARVDVPLNVLVGMENAAGSGAVCAVSIFGKAEDEWKSLCVQQAEFAPHDHLHLYFRIPASCMSPGFWGMDELEELELTAGVKPPDPRERGTLVFCV